MNRAGRKVNIAWFQILRARAITATMRPTGQHCLTRVLSKGLPAMRPKGQHPQFPSYAVLPGCGYKPIPVLPQFFPAITQSGPESGSDAAGGITGCQRRRSRRCSQSSDGSLYWLSLRRLAPFMISVPNLPSRIALGIISGLLSVPMGDRLIPRSYCSSGLHIKSMNLCGGRHALPYRYRT